MKTLTDLVIHAEKNHTQELYVKAYEKYKHLPYNLRVKKIEIEYYSNIQKDFIHKKY